MQNGGLSLLYGRAFALENGASWGAARRVRAGTFGTKTQEALEVREALTDDRK